MPVCLITKDNLSTFIKPEFPLHEAFPYLSAVHRSDYIRAYLMHFYGGAWHDTPCEVSFRDCWNEFEIGYLFNQSARKSKGAAEVYDGHNRYMPDYWEGLGCRTGLDCSGKYGDDNRNLFCILKLLDNNLEALKKTSGKASA